MDNRINNKDNICVEAQLRGYEGPLHGFGLDAGTFAEGWINLMVNFRKNHMW